MSVYDRREVANSYFILITQSDKLINGLQLLQAIVA